MVQSQAKFQHDRGVARSMPMSRRVNPNTGRATSTMTIRRGTNAMGDVGGSNPFQDPAPGLAPHQVESVAPLYNGAGA
jgi:hypothetical protein